MPQQTIMWTALPNGVRNTNQGGRLKLSAFVSVRLDTGGTLSPFPDWLDWPKTLFPSGPPANQLQFEVQFGASAPVPATRMGDKPRSDLWTALFGGASLVRAHNAADIAKFAGKPILSYPAASIQSYLKRRYVTLADEFGTEFPSAGRLTGLFDELADLFFLPGTEFDTDNLGIMKAQLMDELHDKKFLSLNAPSSLAITGVNGHLASAPSADPQRDFVRLHMFHQPFTDTRVAVTKPDIDFHQMVSALGDYPVLMRMLGLVHDLEVPHPGNLGDTTVQVLAKWNPAAGPVVTLNVPAVPGQKLQTNCSSGAQTFLPRPGGSDLADGMLKLEEVAAFDGRGELQRDRAVITFPWLLAFAARAGALLPDALRRATMRPFRFYITRAP